MLKKIKDQKVIQNYQSNDINDLPNLCLEKFLRLENSYLTVPFGRTVAEISDPTSLSFFQSDNGFEKFALFGKKEDLEKALNKLKDVICSYDEDVAEDYNKKEGPIQQALLFEIGSSGQYVILGCGSSEVLYDKDKKVLESFSTLDLIFGMDDYPPSIVLDSMDEDDVLVNYVYGAHDSLWIKSARDYLLKNNLIEIYD